MSGPLATGAGGGGGAGGGDSTYTDTYANIPAASNDGNLFFPSDGYSLYRDTGAAWEVWGPLYPFTLPPAVADLTWVNQQAATATRAGGALHLKTTHTGGNAVEINALVKASGAAPWTFSVALNPYLQNGVNIGICVRQSSDGKLIFFGLQESAGSIYIAGRKFTNPTTHSADYFSTIYNHFAAVHPMWLRIADDNTNRILSVSQNGYDWFALHSVGRTDFLTADQFGVCVYTYFSPSNTAGSYFTWVEA